MGKIMRQADLEMFRHKIHNITKKSVVGNTQLYTYWMEYGAFISIMPRQSGKTMMLERIAKNYLESGEKVIIVTDWAKGKFSGMRKISSILLVNRCSGIKFNEYNLIIDEFDFISRKCFIDILNYKWKTVTMAGSKK